jgi:N-acetylneuraminic acid mutarotase
MKISKFSLLIALLFIVSIQLIGQTWDTKASLPNNIGKHHPVTFGIDGFGYSVTGTSAASQTSKDFYKYDPANDSWSQLTDFPGAARSFAIGQAYEGKAYMGFGYQFSFLNDLWEFDPITDSWTQLASCPCEGRRHPAFIVAKDRIFVGLGDGNSGNLKDWWSYDIATDTWSQEADLPGPVRHHPYMFAAGDHIYAGMGHGGNNIYGDWYEFDIDTDTWTKLNNFPGESRVAGTQFGLGGYGYVLSGDGDNHSFMSQGEFWEYDPFNDNWAQLPSHPGISRWAPGSFTLDNTVYFLGGQNRSSGVINGDMWSYQLGPVASRQQIVAEEQKGLLYPNPTKGLVNLNTSMALETIQVFSLSGEMIKEITNFNNPTINLNNLSKGMYWIKASSENQVFIEKLVVN